jgi:cytidylate kinase
MTSAVTGVNKKTVISSEEQVANSFWYTGFLGGDSATYDKVNGAHEEVIKKLAQKGSCVFIGRCASHVLRDKENVIRVFICAPMEIRRKRVSEGYKITPAEAGKLITKNDKARASYYKKYTKEQWGKPENYDLIINTKIGTKKAVAIIADYVKEIIK